MSSCLKCINGERISIYLFLGISKKIRIYPKSLPEYGTKIILVIVLDEDFAYRDYFNNIHCIIRCLGTRPVYLDGVPSNKLRAIAFFHFLYKQSQLAKLLARELRKFHRLKLSEARRKTLHVPVGLF